MSTMRADLESEFEKMAAEVRKEWQDKYHEARNKIDEEQRSFMRQMDDYGVSDKFDVTPVVQV